MISDLELVRRVQNGDKAAFDELLTRHFKAVVNYINRFTNDRVNSEDLAQEVFLRIYRSIGRYKPEAKFSTWLYKIATNVCLSSLKSSKKDSHLMSLDDLQDGPYGAELGDGAAPDASEYTYRRQLGAEIHRALGTLPERERVAVVLCKYEQLSYEEAAEVIGCSVGAVKAYVHRGRMKLMDKLKHLLSEERVHESE